MTYLLEQAGDIEHESCRVDLGGEDSGDGSQGARDVSCVCHDDDAADQTSGADD